MLIVIKARSPASGAPGATSISGGILIGGIGGSMRASSGKGWLVRSGLRSHSGTSAGGASAVAAGGAALGGALRGARRAAAGRRVTGG